MSAPYESERQRKAREHYAAMTEPHTVEVTQQVREVAADFAPLMWPRSGTLKGDRAAVLCGKADDHPLVQAMARLASTPPLPATEMVEAVAEAFAKADGYKWFNAEDEAKYSLKRSQDNYRRRARAAIPIVTAAERERCAKVAEGFERVTASDRGPMYAYCRGKEVAAAIRAGPLTEEF